MKKAIEIEEMRISSNGEHLEFIINCPDNCRFTTFTIEVMDETFSIGESLFYNEDGTLLEETRFASLVPVRLFGVSRPEIYKIHLEAIDLGTCTVPEELKDLKGFYVKDGLVYNKYDLTVVDEDKSNHAIVSSIYFKTSDGTFRYKNNDRIIPFGEDKYAVGATYSIVYVKDKATMLQSVCKEGQENAYEYNTPITADAYISDVSHAYTCLVDDILALNSKCTDREVQDRVIRNYLMLYAHQEALHLGYMDEAKKWFGYIDNCFNGCGGKDKTGSGCGCSHSREVSRPKVDFYTNCGCSR